MRYTAWLIERQDNGPVWVSGWGTWKAEWTRNAWDAVHFCRKQDAEKAMECTWCPPAPECFVTEHIFDDSPTSKESKGGEA